MARKKLEGDVVKKWLAEHAGWKLVEKGKSIRKQFKFTSFRDSIVFVNRVATLADQADHHPDLDIRYDKVLLTLSTHSASGLTQKDLDLARSVDHATSAR